MRTVRIGLVWFLAITAIAGGIGLLTGVIAPPQGLLDGSPFDTYLIPGGVLLGLVGGSALMAALLLLGRHPLARPAALLAAGMILAFEGVEILVIGSPPGVARSLQVFYVCLGLGLVALGAVPDR